MINPNGDEFMEQDPSTQPLRTGEETLYGTKDKLRYAAQRASDVASDTWDQARQTAGTARERTEFFLRQNPVPTVLGALMVGLAIGLAIRYASRPSERTINLRTPFGDADLSALNPFLKKVKRRYEDSAEAVREGVDRLRDIDVDRYVKPLRKRWQAWRD